MGHGGMVAAKAHAQALENMCLKSVLCSSAHLCESDVVITRVGRLDSSETV